MTPDELRDIPPEQLPDLTLGDRIRWVRVRRKLSVDAFATLLGTGRGRVIAWEKGRSGIGPEYASKVAAEGDVPVELFQTAERPLSEIQRSFANEVARLAELNAEYQEQLRALEGSAPPRRRRV